jgi:hypothetical protein
MVLIFLVASCVLGLVYSIYQYKDEPDHARFDINYSDELLQTFLDYEFLELTGTILEVAKVNEIWGVVISIDLESINVKTTQVYWEYGRLVEEMPILATEDMELHVRAFTDPSNGDQLWLSSHYEHARKDPFQHWDSQDYDVGEFLLLKFLKETGWDEKMENGGNVV